MPKILNALGITRFNTRLSSDSDDDRELALNILSKYGVDANLYLPAAGCDVPDLIWALNHMGKRGYIMTLGPNAIVGVLAKARPTTDDIAQQRRSQFKVVETHPQEGSLSDPG